MNFDPIRMHGIVRYANRVRIKDEDLAQHSCSVAYYCFIIAKRYKIPDEIRNEAIAMSIVHDIGECFTSDLPHDVKQENPELKELCDKLEQKYIDQIPEVKETWHKLENNKNSIQHIMVKLGDSMSAKSYVERELSLGNQTKEMIEIYEEIKERTTNLEKRLDDRMEEYHNGKSFNSNTEL